MQENNLVEETMEIAEVNDEVTEVEECLDEETSGNGAAIIAGGIAVVGLAGYGIYKLGKDHVVPGIKKGINAIKGKITEAKNKKDADVIDADFEEVDFDEEESKEEAAK